MECPRCKKECKVTIISAFNNDKICVSCFEIESEHPKFEEAVRSWQEAKNRNDSNFEGIGWPPPEEDQ